MKTIFSITDDKSKGFFDKQRKFRDERGKARKQRLISGQDHGVGFGRFNTGELARRKHAMMMGHNGFGKGYNGALRTSTDASTTDAVKNAGSITGNDELNRRVSEGYSEREYMDDRSEEIYKTRINAEQSEYNRVHKSFATGDDFYKMEKRVRSEARSQAGIEIGQVKAGYGEFGTGHAILAATKAKMASASAYNHTQTSPDGDEIGDLDADYEELYGDVARLVKGGYISTGDGIGMVKGYMQNRPDMKGAAAGVTLQSVEEATAGYSGKGPATLSDTTLGNLARSSLRNLDSSAAVRSDARAARNLAPVLNKEIDKRYREKMAAVGTPDEAKKTRAFKEIMATAGNIMDAQSSGTEEVRNHWARAFDQNVGDSSESVQVGVEALRGDLEFQQFRRELTANQQAQSQLGVTVPTTGGTGGVGGGPGVGTP